MNTIEAFRDLVRKAIEEDGMNLHQIASQSGAEGSSLSNWYNYKQKSLNFDTVGKVMDFLGVNLNTIKRVNPYAPMELVVGDNVIPVDVCIMSGAGDFVHFDRLERISTVNILKDYYYPNLLVVQIEGDSMQPTIQKGAHVGIIPFTGELTEGRIYIVKSKNFGLTCKRIKSSPDGEILLTSDNPNHPTVKLEPEEKQSAVWGQVMWVMQNL